MVVVSGLPGRNQPTPRDLGESPFESWGNGFVHGALHAQSMLWAHPTYYRRKEQEPLVDETDGIQTTECTGNIRKIIGSKPVQYWDGAEIGHALGAVGNLIQVAVGARLLYGHTNEIQTITGIALLSLPILTNTVSGIYEHVRAKKIAHEDTNRSIDTLLMG
jgi:hypothetical protein